MEQVDTEEIGRTNSVFCCFGLHKFQVAFADSTPDPTLDKFVRSVVYQPNFPIDALARG